jgi:hypothetical protein
MVSSIPIMRSCGMANRVGLPRCAGPWEAAGAACVTDPTWPWSQHREAGVVVNRRSCKDQILHDYVSIATGGHTEFPLVSPLVTPTQALTPRAGC